VAKHFLVDEGEGRWFDYGTDHGKPVRLRVHALTNEEERTARRAAYGNRKIKKLSEETFVRTMDRGEAYTRERAKLALDESENFNVEVSGAKAAALFSELLKREVKAGAEVCLDGQWTPEIRAALFPRLKMLARDISDFADQVVKTDAEEEEDATQDFSQP
jgi:hypothetical protein